MNFQIKNIKHGESVSDTLEAVAKSLQSTTKSVNFKLIKVPNSTTPNFSFVAANAAITVDAQHNATGTEHFNIVRGGVGNSDDVLSGGGGFDILIGGAGNDTASYAYLNSGTEGVEVDLARRAATVNDGDVDILSGIENVTGSKNNDILKGNSGNNIFKTGGGNDIVDGRGGTDTIILTGKAEDWRIVPNPDGYSLADKWITITNGPDSVTFRNIEKITFEVASEDGSIKTFNVGGSSSGGTDLGGASVIARDDGNDENATTTSDNNNAKLKVTEGDSSGNFNPLQNDTIISNTGTDSVLVTGVSASNGVFQKSATNSFGTLVCNSDGTVIFTADGAASNALAQGQQAAATFFYQVVGGDTAQVTFTVTGINDGPTILTEGTTTSASVKEDVDNDPATLGTQLTGHGTIIFDDIDLADSHTVTVMGSGANGGASLGSLTTTTTQATGASTGSVTWTYNLDNALVQGLAEGARVIETFKIIIDDKRGAENSKIETTISIEIVGTNDIPVVVAPVSVLVTENTVVSGFVAATDADSGQTATLTYALVSPNGAPSGLTFNSNGSYSFDASSYDHLPAGVQQTLTIQFTAKDVAGATSQPGTLTITITGTNDTAIVTTAAVKLQETNAFLTTSGTLMVTDVDDGEASFISQNATAGSYGTFTITAEGTWTFTANSTFDALPAGAEKTETFGVKTIDGTESFVTITIIGTNDAAVISGTSSGTVIEDADYDAGVSGVQSAISGDLNATDIDGTNDAWTPVEPVSDSYGTFEMNAAGQWVFTLNNSSPVVQSLAEGQTVKLTYNVATADGTPAAVAVTVRGSNDAPTVDNASVQTGTVTEDADVTPSMSDALVASNTFTVSDIDQGDDLAITSSLVSAVGNGSDGHPVTGALLTTLTNAFMVSPAGVTTVGDATVTGAPVTWTYTLPNADVQYLDTGESITLTFVVSVKDNAGATTQVPVTVTINGTNDAPIVTGASFIGNEDAVFRGNVPAGTDVDDTSFTYRLVDGPDGLVFHSDGSFSYDPTVTYNGLGTGQTAQITFTYVANDGEVDSAPATIRLTIAGRNDAPVVVNDTITTTENAPVSLNVLANDTDPDVADHLSATYGTPAIDSTNATVAGLTALQLASTLTTNMDGTVSFNPGTLFDVLAAGQTATLTLPYTASDGTTGTMGALTITISGTNDAPVCSAVLGVRDFIVNGSFENPMAPANNFISTNTVPGWELINAGNNSSGDRFEIVRENFGSFPTPFGSQWLDSEESPSQSGDGFLQVVHGLADGQSYTLVFALRSQSDLPSSITVNWNNQQIPSGLVQFPNNLGSSVGDGWSLYSFTVQGGAARDASTASGDNVLSFVVASIGNDGNVGVAIDNVQLLAFSANTAIQVTENVIGLGQIIGDINGSDVDGGTVTYSFGADGDGGGRFLIDSVTGNIRVKDGATFNFEGETDADAATPGVQIALTVTLDDNQGQTNSTSICTVYVTVNDVNEKPVLVAAEMGGSITDGPLLETFANLIGQIDSANVIDPDVGGGNDATSNFEDLSFTLVGSGVTAFGTLTVNANGSYTFVPDSAAINGLDSGENRTLSFNVKATDGGGLFVTVPLTIQINGANDAPTVGNIGIGSGAGGNANGNLFEDCGVLGTQANVSNGNLVTGNATDVDDEPLFIDNIVAGASGGTGDGVAITSPVTINGTYGFITVQPGGSYIYTLYGPGVNYGALNALGQDVTATETFSFSVTDGTAASNTATLTFTVVGTNDEPTITSTVGAAQTVQEDATTGSNTSVTPLSGKIDFADPDAGDDHTATLGAISISVNLGGAHIVLSASNTAPTLGSLFGPGVPAAYASLTVGEVLAQLSAAFSVTEVSDGQTGQYSWTFDPTGPSITQGQLDFLPAGAEATITFPVSIGDGKNPAWTAPGGVAGSKTGANDVTQDVVITFKGANDIAVVGGVITGTVTEDGKDDSNDATPNAATATGLLTIADADFGQNSFQAKSGATTYGSYTVATGGTWTYTVGTSSSIVQALAVGEHTTDSFTVLAADGTPQTITITINGTNDAPTIVSSETTASATYTEIGPVSPALAGPTGDPTAVHLSGTIAFTDVDLSDVHTQSLTGAPTYTWTQADGTTFVTPPTGFALPGTFGLGTVTENATTAGGTVGWTYDARDKAFDFLGAGQTLTINQEVTISDTHGASTTQVVSVRITGTNDGPTVKDFLGNIDLQDLLNATTDTDEDGFHELPSVDLLELVHAQDVDNGDKVTVKDIDPETAGVQPGLTGTVTLNLAAEPGDPDSDLPGGVATSFSFDITTLLDLGMIQIDANGVLSVAEGFTDVLGAVMGEGDSLVVDAELTVTDTHGATATADIDFSIIGHCTLG